MLIAGFSFAWMNACVKYISHIPIFEIILFRAGITLFISYIILRRKKVAPWGTHHRFLIARGIFGALGLICYLYTMQQMALANAIIIHYLSPIFTTLIALLFLKERVRMVQWFSFIISFIGVVMVKGFSNVNTFDFLMGIAGAFFTGLAYNAIRNMKGKEDADVIIFYQPLVAFPLVVIYAFIFPNQFVVPVGMDWFYLIATGVFTQIGQYFITRAYQADTAARISSISYVGILWAVLMGKFLFNDRYPIDVLFGMLIVLSGIILNINALKFSNKLSSIKQYLFGE
jgi:drug/metabolite transporter (DMT)-like permease